MMAELYEHSKPALSEDRPDFTAHLIFFDIVATEPMWLHAHNGSALRGMLYRALIALSEGRRLSGNLQIAPQDPVLRRLLATLDEQSDRGQDVQRPYVIVPPLLVQAEDLDERDRHILQAGEGFTFGITLFGAASEAFQFVVMGMRAAEEDGIGRPLGNGRGRFAVVRATAHNPLTETTQELYAQGSTLVRMPDVQVTPAHVMAQANLDAQHHPTRLRLHFHTPMTLRHQGQPVHVPHFHVLIHRLIERLTQMSEIHAGARLACLPADREGRNALLHLADQVQLADNQTRWVPARGFSDRTNKPTDLGGLMGHADYVTDHPDGLTSFLPILRWGELTHAGRHTVKGNGLFRMQLLGG